MKQWRVEEGDKLNTRVSPDSLEYLGNFQYVVVEFQNGLELDLFRKRDQAYVKM
jgi:hypothetical protein